MGDEGFSNMDVYTSGKNNSALSIKSIRMLQVQKVMNAGSVEFKGGFWQNVPIGNNITKIYVANTRQGFTNATEMLRSISLNEYDDIMKKEDAKLLLEEKERKEAIIKSNQKPDEGNKEWNLFTIGWHRRLFESILALYGRLNYFQEKRTEDDMDDDEDNDGLVEEVIGEEE